MEKVKFVSAMVTLILFVAVLSPRSNKGGGAKW